MKLLQSFLSWLEVKLDAWLTKVGEENRPIDHDYSGLPGEDPLVSRSDLIGDERGDWDDRYL